MVFHSNKGYVNSPECCVTRTLPVLSQPHMKYTSYDVPAVALQVCYAHIITTERAFVAVIP